ncbi:N-acetylglucosamine kinase [Agromyces albus]|uniref:N-acetylglucosamine kinase n=1 Tax=Agromyces albus TaxID=205332 RepID=UPI002783492F|nr:BadF/BadG/BcrA/BcrD ATPase family protein [Agromyces albus]MDQ0575781.1 glucosamine kinase [Agromyces albus]
MRLRFAHDARHVEVETPGVLTDRPVLEQISEVAHAFAREHSLEIAELAVGLSGLTPAAAQPIPLLESVAALGVQRVAIAHDSVSGYLAANGDEPGVVLAIGTGVVTLAVTARGAAKVDGWGSLLGDAGSGYWIGRAGLDAVLRSYDGRGASTVLAALAVEAFGPLDDLYMRLQGDDRRVSRIASFARAVVESAESGDPAAAHIVTAAGRELAHSAAAALERAGHANGEAIRVSAVGGIVRGSAYVRGALVAALAERGRGEGLAAPLGAPIDGVARLLDVRAGHPLESMISVAAR